MKGSRLWGGEDKPHERPPGAQFKPNLEVVREPISKVSTDLPHIPPATTQDLPVPTARLEQPLADEIRATQMIYCYMRSLSHDARARALKIVIMWLGETDPDPRDLRDRLQQDLITQDTDGEPPTGPAA